MVEGCEVRERRLDPDLISDYDNSTIIAELDSPMSNRRENIFLSQQHFLDD